ncbi:MAG: YlxR family protein [Calditrichaeota bacterium]|nr:MAG: YlxR family protein [Calditrichota bacterium]
MKTGRKKPGHIPERTCIGCNGKFAKSTLVRFVLTKDENLLADPLQSKPGRGVYLCKKMSCTEQAVKRKRLNRAFRRNLRDEVYNELMKAVKSYE